MGVFDVADERIEQVEFDAAMKAVGTYLACIYTPPM